MKVLVLVVSIVGGILFLGQVAATVTVAVVTAAHDPKNTVSAFLDDLVAGEAEAAAARLHDVPTDLSVLVNDEVYGAADDRITGYTILDSVSSNGTATVRVALTIGGDDVTETFELTAVDKDLVWPVWGIEAGTLPRVDITFFAPEGFGLAANGVALPAGGVDGGENLVALPGTYSFGPATVNELITTEAQDVTLTSFTSNETAAATFEVALTEAGVAKANSALNAFVDGCIAQHTLAPGPECGFEIIDDGTAWTSIVWTLTRRPTASIEPYDGYGFWVETTQTGVFDLRAENSSYYATGTVDDYEYSGYIQVDADGAVTYESDYIDE